MARITRRDLLGKSSLAAAGLGAYLPSLAETSSGADGRKLKIVVVGAHPDDPETGCGGTIARYTNGGHHVTIIYLTRGEAGIPGKSAQEAAAIRTAECEKACAILKARPLFAGQIDGDTEVNVRRYADFQKLLAAENPDIVFTHWPVDSHRDHRAASLLTYDAWLDSSRKWDLYYFEVLHGEQTQVFEPTEFVDITSVAAEKKAACFAHASQRPTTDFWPQHEAMAKFRGKGCGVPEAEGFVRHWLSRETGVPVKE